jgi:hypothetical protein
MTAPCSSCELFWLRLGEQCELEAKFDCARVLRDSLNLTPLVLILRQVHRDPNDFSANTRELKAEGNGHFTIPAYCSYDTRMFIVFLRGTINLFLNERSWNSCRCWKDFPKYSTV